MRRRQVLAAQGAYYVATGVSPLVSRRLFEAVTGPKLEWWLVQTVGALVTVAGAGLVSASRSGRDTPEIIGMAAGCAVALGGIEAVYVARGRISPVYLLDAALQAGALAALAAAGPAEAG